MRSAALIFSIITLGVLAVTFWLFMPSSGPSSGESDAPAIADDSLHSSDSPQLPQPHIVNLTIVDGHRAEGPSIVQVFQGDKLLLRFNSDSDGELHLHGYDLQVGLVAGKTVSLELVAKISGRFEYELHGGHGDAHEPLGVIEVMPR